MKSRAVCSSALRDLDEFFKSLPTLMPPTTLLLLLFFLKRPLSPKSKVTLSRVARDNEIRIDTAWHSERKYSPRKKYGICRVQNASHFRIVSHEDGVLASGARNTRRDFSISLRAEEFAFFASKRAFAIDSLSRLCAISIFCTAYSIWARYNINYGLSIREDNKSGGGGRGYNNGG